MKIEINIYNPMCSMPITTTTSTGMPGGWSRVI